MIKYTYFEITYKITRERKRDTKFYKMSIFLVVVFMFMYRREMHRVNMIFF